MSIGLLILLGIVLGVPLLLFWSARSGLDRAMQHTRATEALPKLAAQLEQANLPVDSEALKARLGEWNGYRIDPSDAEALGKRITSVVVFREGM